MVIVTELDPARNCKRQRERIAGSLRLPGRRALIGPSYGETGLKVQFSGDVLEIDGAQTIPLVDFDVEQSFGQQAGQSGMWVMHPVVTGAEIETE